MNRAEDMLTRWPALDAAAKRIRLQDTFHMPSGPLTSVTAQYAPAAERALAALWRRDAEAWSAEPDVQAAIASRLGWLSSPLTMADEIDRLLAFASSVRQAGFTDVVLLGMGGSSLAPEVLRAVLGVAPGWPQLHVLDSTDPAAIAAATTSPERTLYLFSSKSGGTIEPNALAAYFRQRLEHSGITTWAKHFVAITDEGTPLAARARADQFREVFINPSDIGGRYSAMSFFGLVPAALMGQNIHGLLGWAIAMLAAAQPGFGSAAENPAAGLGLAMGAAARTGRDKLTLIVPPALEAFGLWVEQLVAESTGKQGTGIVPITGEAVGPPSVYGDDRLFVRVRLHGSYAEEMRDSDVGNLTAAHDPVAEAVLAEPSALGAEFVRWEIATAVAGALLQINPFDEPNVQQAKQATQRILVDYKRHGRLPSTNADHEDTEVAWTLSAAAREELDNQVPERILTLLRPRDYFALLAYIGPDRELLEELKALRLAVRDRARVATMFGYGPRYLHSTGQLHKGGPNTGVFMLLSAAPRADLTIPHELFSFGTLEMAQALGDFASLDAAGRRVVHVHLVRPNPDLVRSVAAAVLDRLRRSE